MYAGSQGIGPFFTAFPGHNQGSEWEIEHPGLEQVPVRDANTTDEGLVYYTTKPASRFSFLKSRVTEISLSKSCKSHDRAQP